jgi:hypothetical protein
MQSRLNKSRFEVLTTTHIITKSAQFVFKTIVKSKGRKTFARAPPEEMKWSNEKWSASVIIYHPTAALGVVYCRVYLEQ